MKQLKKRLLSIVTIAVFLVSLIYMTPVIGASTPLIGGQTSSLDDIEGISGTPLIAPMVVEGAQPDTGNPWTVITLDFLDDTLYYQEFECVLEGVFGNIWIGLNDTDWNGYQDYYDDMGTPEFDDDEFHFMYPWTHTGIPEYGIPPGYHDVIYGRNLTYILNEFDTNIHDTDVEYFGEYADRPGPLNDYKIQILIFNIRDWLFWTPVEAPYFVAGYYWYFASMLNNANIIHIDTWQWGLRLGYQPPPSTHSREYEGTVAHEFQHLIHRDVDNDEMSWVNEGCSTLAEYVCGYGFSPGHISEYLIWHWDVSLVIWESTLADYGASFLWTFYMYEHYGGKELIWDVVHEQANGIEGYNNVLKKHHIKKTFDEIFQDWAMANYLDDTSFADGIYGYYDLDIPSENTVGMWGWQWDIPTAIWVFDVLGYFDFLIDSYPTVNGMVTRLPYIAQYYEFYDFEPKLELYFDGDDFSGIPAHSGMYHWYSDGVPYSWFRLGQSFDIPETGAELKFWSYYSIEEDWDYGYVEVHDVDTDEWYTLPGLTTVSTLPHPQDNPNCPDAFEPAAYWIAGRWNAFTGSSYGWYQETMDLSPFAGHTIELYFTYWTDPYTLGIGWYVDDIEIPEIGFFDDVESGADGWTYTGWDIAESVILLNDFEVNFIRELVFIKDGMKAATNIIPMELDDDTEDGWEVIPVINEKKVYSIDPTVMVVANQPGYEHTFETFYWFYASIKP